MKSISPVVATIILIVMLVAIASTAFLWISGYFQNLLTQTEERAQISGVSFKITYAAWEGCGNWIEWNGHCYYYNSSDFSWIDSFKICLSLNSHLVTINTKDELKWINSTILSKGNINEGVWIGLVQSGKEWNAKCDESTGLCTLYFDKRLGCPYDSLDECINKGYYEKIENVPLTYIEKNMVLITDFNNPSNTFRWYGNNTESGWFWVTKEPVLCWDKRSTIIEDSSVYIWKPYRCIEWDYHNVSSGWYHRNPSYIEEDCTNTFTYHIIANKNFQGMFNDWPCNTTAYWVANHTAFICESLPISFIIYNSGTAPINLSQVTAIFSKNGKLLCSVNLNEFYIIGPHGIPVDGINKDLKFYFIKCNKEILRPNEQAICRVIGLPCEYLIGKYDEIKLCLVYKGVKDCKKIKIG